MTLDLKGNYFQDNRTIFRALEDFFDDRDGLLLDCPNYDKYIQKMLGCLIYKESEIYVMKIIGIISAAMLVGIAMFLKFDKRVIRWLRPNG